MPTVAERNPATVLVLVALLGAGTGCGSGGAGAVAPDTDPWAPVDAEVTRSVAADAIPGLTLAVYDRDDRLVFERTYGDFAPDRRVAVASGSKLVSSLVLLDLVGRGTLSLDDTTGAVLGWTGPNAAITLRQLLSFTSGLPPDADCTGTIATTLAACVETIGASAAVAPPGTRFDYGSTHLQVAARMAEVRTGKVWNALFRERLADPLGLPPEVAYFTAPRSAIGTQNPLVAGGLRTSMREYAPLLAIAFHRGASGGLTIAAPELFDAQAREPYPSVTIGHSPAVDLGFDFRYGLGSWLECSTPAEGCSTLSSPGAFGWTPWYDRDAGYYAILGTELPVAGGDFQGVTFRLEQRLEPLVRAALGR